jgi:hypothetical protein
VVNSEWNLSIFCLDEENEQLGIYLILLLPMLSRRFISYAQREVSKLLRSSQFCMGEEVVSHGLLLQSNLYIRMCFRTSHLIKIIETCSSFVWVEWLMRHLAALCRAFLLNNNTLGKEQQRWQ